MSDEKMAVVQHQQAGSGQIMEFSPQQVVNQVQLIQQVMKACMKDKEHFGVIPGCGEKPSLLKPGAEKLVFTFRLAPDYEVDTIDMANGHREYRVKCKMTHIVSQSFLGSGVGSGSTMETKFRYRNENTGKPVPKEYWDTRDKALLGGDDFTPRKVDKAWVIYHQVEHPNPADYYNTVLKMAKKRALVDAVLTCTAASDIFTQDLEDLKENGVIDTTATETVAAPQKAPIREPQAAAQQQPAQDKGAPAATKPSPEPARKTQPSSTSGLADDEVLVTLGKIGTKTGTGPKGPWTRWYTKASDDVWYSTFYKALGKAMESLENSEAIIQFKDGRGGRDVLNIRLPADDQQEPAQDTPGNTDAENREGEENLPF